MPVVDTIPIYAVIGSEPGKDAKALEIFLDKENADHYVRNGLVQAMMMHRGGAILPGEQISMILTVAEDDSSMTTGSVAVNGPDHRHVWDFRVEKRWAPRS